jgi:hypothetical protein
VSSGSGPHLPAEVGSGAAMNPTVPCESRASRIKKTLAGLPVQLGTHVPNAHTYVSKDPNVRAIMGPQAMQVGSAVNVYKACRQAATMQLQCNASTVDYSPDIATVLGDLTARLHAIDRVQRGRR